MAASYSNRESGWSRDLHRWNSEQLEKIPSLPLEGPQSEKANLKRIKCGNLGLYPALSCRFRDEAVELEAAQNLGQAIELLEKLHGEKPAVPAGR
jgi:hypothetical protein